MCKIIVSSLLTVIIALCLSGCGDADPNNQLSDLAKPEKMKQEPEVELSRDSLVRKTEAFTVRLRNLTCAGVGVGSGFIISHDTIVTNHHVVDGAVLVEINTFNGVTRQGKILSASRYGDIAVVKVDAQFTAIAELGSDPELNDEITAIGFPGGNALASASGRVIDFVTGDDNVPRIVVDAEVIPGNSGGPVIDKTGKVVGVVVEKMNTGEGLMIPISAAESMVTAGEEQFEVTPCEYNYR